MVHNNAWATRVLALLKGGNAGAAVAQIKVAPSLKDLKALQTALTTPALAGRWPTVDTAVAENLQALAAPRLHRSP